MTTELIDIVAQVKLATDYQTNKRILREKIITQLHMPFNSGLFKISPEILAFVSTWPTATLYLEDVYQNPIEIDKQVFLVNAQQHYFSVMNDWHEQHEQLKRIRKI